MANEKNIRLDYHLRFNARNPMHVKAARVLASVGKRYKSSFIALAVLHYMQAHPYGIDTQELLKLYRQTDRRYVPKTPIVENLKKAGAHTLPEAPAQVRDSHDQDETNDAIDKAMDFYDVL